MSVLERPEKIHRCTVCGATFNDISFEIQADLFHLSIEDVYHEFRLAGCLALDVPHSGQ